MVVLSALPARDTDKPVPTNNTTRNTTKNAAGRWSVRKNLGLLASFGGSTAATSSNNTKDDGPASATSPSASPPSSPPPAVVDHISEIHPASYRKTKREHVSTSAATLIDKTSTESNRSWETTNTTATAWSSGTFEYDPSDASSSGASSASPSSPSRPSTFLQTYETNHSNSANMSTSSSRQSRRPSTSSSSSASGRRTVRPGTAGDVVRAIAQSASSLGIASSTTTSTAEAGTGVPGSRSRTKSPASSSSPNNMPSTLPRPPALAERNVPRSTSDGSNVIHARIRRRYSNPDLPNMVASASAAAASASLASAGTAPTTTSSRGGIRSSEHASVRMPRRSSLKKVSSYGPEASERSSSNNGTSSSSRRRTNASSSAAPTGMSRRRHSMVDLTTAGQDDNNNDNESLRNQRRTRRSTSLPTICKEVTFDSAVSYATISYVHDICPKAPERLFYADEDYHRMKGAIRADVKQIKLETKKRQEQKKTKETEKHRYSSDKYMDGTPRNVKTSSYLPSYDYGEEEVESDSDLCNWGIEHHTCSKAERQERSERARSVINSVLWKQSIIRQSKSSSDLRNPDLVDTITSKLARTFIKASQVARIQAVERATRVEFHCSKIIDRRHSEGDAKYGARILDGLSDSEDEGIGAGKVKDASLDEVVVVGRRRPAYQRRASLA